MHVTVNGESRDLESPFNCLQLVEQMALGGKRFAVERNGEIVPRSRLAQEMIAEGDRLEIVIAVGGG